MARPPRSALFDESEEKMNDAAEIQAESAPIKTRGLREAAIRAEQIRNNVRSVDRPSDFHDDFYIDPTKIPEGWDYNWKAMSVAGMEDKEHMIEMRRTGWEPVDATRHPEMMEPGYKGYIQRRGMLLMERPSEISNNAKQREIALARQAVKDKEAALGMTTPGGFDFDRKSVRKSFGPMDVPRS